MKQFLRFALAAALVWTVTALPVQAGTGCVQRTIQPEEVRNAFNMAVRTREYLERSGASLALVARAGADLSEHGLRYSHMGAVLRDHPAGRWTFVHLLNECGADTSGIYDEGLVNFYLDDLHAFEGLILIPVPELQARLSAILASPRALQLHHPGYSMIARPTSTKYQNSNQWLLETIAMAQASDGQVTTREQAQNYYVSRGYRADTVQIGDLQRLGAGITRANVRFDDHTTEEAASRRYEVVSVRSVGRYLDDARVIVDRAVITLDAPPRPPLKY